MKPDLCPPEETTVLTKKGELRLVVNCVQILLTLILDW